MTKEAEALRFSAMLDEILEDCLQERRTVADMLSRVLPVLIEKTGAQGAFVRTFADDLGLATFAWPEGFEAPELAQVLERTNAQAREELALHTPGGLVIARPLDVAGEWFGHAGLVVDPSGPAAKDPGRLRDLLTVFCEQIDNLLFMVRAAREKHRLTMQLGEALRHRVLGEGLRQAVKVLSAAVPLRRLLLVCVAEEGRSSNLHVQVFEQGAVMVDTMGGHPRHPEEPTILDEARAYLDTGDPALLRRFEFEGALENVLINGITQSSLVGKLVATARNGVFNTYDRELLAAFASYIRQRVVDFNKEWRTLAVSFPPRDVTRLLQVDNYARRYLEPREAEVAILYADIAGFTRLSEQVLQSPAKVAELVEVWSRDAVEPRLGARRALRQDGGGLHHRALRATLLRDEAGGAPGQRDPLRAGDPGHDAALGRAARARGVARPRGGGRHRPQPVSAVRGPLRAQRQLHRLLAGHEQHRAPPGLRGARRDPGHGRVDPRPRRSVRIRLRPRALGQGQERGRSPAVPRAGLEEGSGLEL